MNTAVADITGIGGTGVFIIAGEWGSRKAGTLGARIVHGAGIAIFAGECVVDVLTANAWLAGIVGTRVIVVTSNDSRAGALSANTLVFSGTGIAIVAWTVNRNVDTAFAFNTGAGGAWIVVYAGQRCTNTRTGNALVSTGTGIAIRAGGCIGSIKTTKFWVAGIIGARIGIIAIQ